MIERVERVRWTSRATVGFVIDVTWRTSDGIEHRTRKIAEAHAARLKAER